MSVLRGAKKAIRDKRIHLILLEYGDKVRATLCWTFTRSILAPVGQISSRRRDVLAPVGEGFRRIRAMADGRRPSMASKDSPHRCTALDAPSEQPQPLRTPAHGPVSVCVWCRHHRSRVESTRAREHERRALTMHIKLRRRQTTPSGTRCGSPLRRPPPPPSLGRCLAWPKVNCLSSLCRRGLTGAGELNLLSHPPGTGIQPETSSLPPPPPSKNGQPVLLPIWGPYWHDEYELCM
eukprot:scaffold4543_cov126-Isochrysis_galbana.AAC.10